MQKRTPFLIHEPGDPHRRELLPCRGHAHAGFCAPRRRKRCQWVLENLTIGVRSALGGMVPEAADPPGTERRAALAFVTVAPAQIRRGPRALFRRCSASGVGIYGIYGDFPKRLTVRNRAPSAPRTDPPGPADGRPRPIATRRETVPVIVPEGPVARPRATDGGGKPSVKGNVSPRQCGGARQGLQAKGTSIRVREESPGRL